MAQANWIVGIDLRARSDGALRFAAWVRERAVANAAHSLPHLHGVHVLERDKLRHVAAIADVAQIEALTRDRTHELLRTAGATEAFGEAELIVDADAETALCEVVKRDSAEALVIGRKAQLGTDPVVRLGRVARRVLRALPCPVIVTPPDLELSSLGAGPVILATDCREDTREAADFALRLAELTGRELIVLHVVPMPEAWGAHYLPSASAEHVSKELQAGGERDLERWSSQQGLQGRAGMVVQGGVVPQVITVARELDAVAIVTGSRGMGAVARFFVTSVGSELAAAASCPVAVVPA